MIHHVFANRSNVGDWLSAAGIQSVLGRPVREHLCDDPFVPATLRALAGAAAGDVVVVGGGGLFMDYFTPLWRGLTEHAGHLRLVIWGAGLVDLKREPSRMPEALARSVAERAEVCVVRDELTAEFLGTGEVVPCPSLVAVAPRPRGDEDGVLHCANLTTVGDAAYDVMRRAAQEFAARTGRVFRETANRIEPDDRRAMAEVLDVYARSERVLSSRLHGCLIALATGRPVLAVSGDRKVEELMTAAGLRDWVLPWDALEDLRDALAAVGAQPPAAALVTDSQRAHADIARRVRELDGA